MAFRNKSKEPARPLTREELIARHRQLAEDHIARSAQAGRLEAETRHATMATAHAVLALSYQMDPPTAPPPPQPPEESEVEIGEPTSSE
ncbi:MAG TPA: hypothetical protein VLX59_02200 [Acidimicrobiales bacterium]|nr:hypothetical protein [Acidimicrobiales bacterium]